MADTVPEALTVTDCWRQLGINDVGRIAFTVGDFPVVLPVNYRVVTDSAAEPYLVIRTRPGNVIDRAPVEVAFEVDGIDRQHRQGYWVLVQGLLDHLDDETVAGLGSDIDPHPWITVGRDSWLVIRPTTLQGGRLVASEAGVTWVFHARAYL